MVGRRHTSTFLGVLALGVCSGIGFGEGLRADGTPEISPLPVDLDGDGVSTFGDRYVFRYWESLGGDTAKVIARARMREEKGSLVIDVSAEFAGYSSRPGESATGGGGGMALLMGGGIASPPVSLGDADDNGALDLSDAIFVLDHLFEAGPPPKVINTTRVLKTGQTTCFFHGTPSSEVDCSEIHPLHPLYEFYYGQDGHYAPTIGLERAYELEDDLDLDMTQSAVKDLRTGLMWQRFPQTTNLNSQGGYTFKLRDDLVPLDGAEGAVAALVFRLKAAPFRIGRRRPRSIGTRLSRSSRTARRILTVRPWRQGHFEMTTQKAQGIQIMARSSPFSGCFPSAVRIEGR